MYLLRPRDYRYISKIKSILDVAKPIFLIFNCFFIREIYSTSAYLRRFIIENYPVKDSIKEKALLVVGIDFGSKT